MQAESVAGTGMIPAGKRTELAALLDDSRTNALCHRLAAVEDVPDIALRGLPLLDAKRSLALWPRLSDAFCRTPNWQGQAAETGAPARRHDATGPANGQGAFQARWLARLNELREWAKGVEKVGPEAGSARSPYVSSTRPLSGMRVLD